MFISLNWIRDFVDLPDDLDPRALAERFTRTTAEVEGVHEVRLEAKDLIAARIQETRPLAGTKNLTLAFLDVGDGRIVQTVSAAPVLPVGLGVVYAPVGAHIAALGHIASTAVAGHDSLGMILPGHALGIELAAQEAVFLDPSVAPGTQLPGELFDDWIIEVDNKSLTHRPDLWGHYGIAREIAAILGLQLKPYPVVPEKELTASGLSEVPISIADPDACRRYSGIVLKGVPTQPAPLWMQLRLGRAGMRPITGLVDLSNYIMAELGQPTHAFDAAKVDRIEVDWARDGEPFRTLDGEQRTLGERMLMIKAGGRSIALAGIMGGLETEVSESTTSLLLESANFDPATIRRTATRLGMRTDASARFEKSLDPVHTVLAIQRFVRLARDMYPQMKLAGRLSDAYPKPYDTVTVNVNPHHVARTVGREVAFDEARRILGAIEFAVGREGAFWNVTVPSFRATNDISIEADVIEELMRFIGYDALPPIMPEVSVRRFPPNKLHELEQRTLEYFATAHGFHEIHNYLWNPTEWLDRIGYDPGPSIELRNAAAQGMEKLRHTLMPGLLAAVEKNRFHFPTLRLFELGSVFASHSSGDREHRHIGLVLAQRGKNVEDDLLTRLKGSIEGWSWSRFERGVTYAQAAAAAHHPWEHAHRTASVLVDGVVLGRISVVDRELRHRINEHLIPWGVAWAELNLDEAVSFESVTPRLASIPPFPESEMDFSFVVPKATRFAQVVTELERFQHPLLRLVRFVGSYEGASVGGDARSLTFRTVLGHTERTLVDEDLNDFRSQLEAHLAGLRYDIRR